MAITETTQYSGTVQWDPSVPGGRFAAATLYTATIRLTAEPGFTLTDVGENFFTVAGADPVENSAGSGVVTAVFPATAGEVITVSNIPGVIPPATGEVPVRDIRWNAQYNLTVSWSPTVADTFDAATQYAAKITLRALSLYSFTAVPADFFKVAGAITVRNKEGSGVVTAVFPRTGESAPVAVTVPNFTLPAPAAGGILARTIETAQYTGWVQWWKGVLVNPFDDIFQSGTTYGATIYLTAKPGFTLEGVPEDFFELPEAAVVRFSSGFNLIILRFPATK